MKKYITTVLSENNKLFTMVLLPDTPERCPVVLQRHSYVDRFRDASDEEVIAEFIENATEWCDNGFAMVMQHCRGCGRSEGEFIPYIHEREDGLALQDWVRKQPFYNGEIYLYGGSYLSSVHYMTAPFAPDIKGAVLTYQDTERYNICYRNGFMRTGLHGGWYMGMYKHKTIRNKNYTIESFQTMPLIDLPQIAFGESAQDFEDMLRSPDRNDDYWNTRAGGTDARDALRHANIPVLLITGLFDIYTGGIFSMWKDMDEETRKKCALVVTPYAHGYGMSGPITFEDGDILKKFGNFELNWMRSVRGDCEKPFPSGEVTYYRLFENKWRTEIFTDAPINKKMQFPAQEFNYVYNPYNPASFRGGLSNGFGGTEYQDKPNSRYDIISIFSEPFEEDRFLKGKMSANLCVKSDCEDTCFYLRVSLDKAEGAYGLRDDITQISNEDKNYVPGSEITLHFTFDDHAFLVKKGERLRIDISSSATPHFTTHKNIRGIQAEQERAKIAHNTIIGSKSYLSYFCEKTENDL